MATSSDPYGPGDRRQLATWSAQAVVTLAAFAVGLLLGARYCHDSPVLGPGGPGDGARGSGAATGEVDCPERVVEKTVTEEKIVYRCPPPEPEPPEEEVEPREVAHKKKPPPAPELDPLLRQRLLAWVRDRASDLKSCRDDSKETYRLAIFWRLDDEGTIQRVDVNKGTDEIPAGMVACLRDRMLDWEPPAELVRGQREIVFGLSL
jgi:hypothetical protein